MGQNESKGSENTVLGVEMSQNGRSEGESPVDPSGRSKSESNPSKNAKPMCANTSNHTKARVTRTPLEADNAATPNRVRHGVENRAASALPPRISAGLVCLTTASSRLLTYQFKPSIGALLNSLFYATKTLQSDAASVNIHWFTVLHAYCS
eukprot:IDg7540t1